MKKALVLLLGVCFVALLVGSAVARDAATIRSLRPVNEWQSGPPTDELATDPGLRGLYEAAAADTYYLVWYTFETTGGLTGWERLDHTLQPDTFFHVDNFVGLGGGDFGGYYPLEGAKSMWCGARANSGDLYLCGWAKIPGYANSWSQDLQTGAFTFTGLITVSFKIAWDSEPDYDYTRLQYDAGGGVWTTVEGAEYTNYGVSTDEYEISLTQSRTKLRFHMTADGAWSIRVRDALSLDNTETFEAAPVNATSSGIWFASYAAPFGKYSGLKSNLTDLDPCGDDFGNQVVFFIGSPNPSSSYPGLYDTPFCKGGGGLEAPCQNEVVVSPVIDMTKYSTLKNKTQDGTIPPADLPALGGAYLVFNVYRDIPSENLVYYQWEVRKVIAGCPQLWKDRNYVYYGAQQDYLENWNAVGDLVSGNDPIQVAVGAVDMCDVWYEGGTDCAAHTPAPWMDQLRVLRYKTDGPQWSYRDLEFFQDNFPNDTLESFVRADCAQDINQATNPILKPGDSVIVTCASLLGGGIDTVAGKPLVYIHVKATYVGPAPVKPNLVGAALAGSIVGKSPTPGTINFNYVSDDGTWTKIQCFFAYNSGGATVADKFMVDLNDALFTRGYKILYYFTATDNAGITSAYPRYARTRAPYFEWSTLPTLNSDVLFVDDFDGRGSFIGATEDFWMPVFDAVLAPPNNNVDKYDVLAPSSGVDNGPGSRAKMDQLFHYRKIVWDSGDLAAYTISDGLVDKANDVAMLNTWMSTHPVGAGLWICGDNVAAEMAGSLAPAALVLMSTWCGVDFDEDSYFDVSGGLAGGGLVTPLLTGDTDSGIFVHGGVPDKFNVYGGCALINVFDVLEKTAYGKYALDYPPVATVKKVGAISSSQLNSTGKTVNTMWFGFSYIYVRDDVLAKPMDRFEIAEDVFTWMDNDVNVDITPAETPKSYNLAQNFPNPFNPSTTIKFDMKAKGFVALKVYNVAGQLVRTLVNGTKDAGSYTITWDGKNNRGSGVASGIYFYKMETKDFSQTKKMVMLR
jgi:hypothetical protein